MKRLVLALVCVLCALPVFAADRTAVVIRNVQQWVGEFVPVLITGWAMLVPEHRNPLVFVAGWTLVGAFVFALAIACLSLRGPEIEAFRNHSGGLP